MINSESTPHPADPVPGPTNEDDGSPILTIELSRAQVERLLVGATLEGDLTTDVGALTLRAMGNLCEFSDPMVYRVRMVE